MPNLMTDVERKRSQSIEMLERTKENKKILQCYMLSEQQLIITLFWWRTKILTTSPPEWSALGVATEHSPLSSSEPERISHIATSVQWLQALASACERMKWSFLPSYSLPATFLILLENILPSTFKSIERISLKLVWISHHWILYQGYRFWHVTFPKHAQLLPRQLFSNVKKQRSSATTTGSFYGDN